jgi:hypothetical protein
VRALLAARDDYAKVRGAVLRHDAGFVVDARKNVFEFLVQFLLKLIEIIVARLDGTVIADTDIENAV